MAILLLRLCSSLILDRSSNFQLDGAPLRASIAACVGMCLYGTVRGLSACFSADFTLCSFAAFRECLILEKTDMLVKWLLLLREFKGGSRFFWARYVLLKDPNWALGFLILQGELWPQVDLIGKNEVATEVRLLPPTAGLLQPKQTNKCV